MSPIPYAIFFRSGAATLLRPFLEGPWILNLLRLVAGFLLLALPATTVGATLPVLVEALRATRASGRCSSARMA